MCRLTLASRIHMFRSKWQPALSKRSIFGPNQLVRGN